MGRRGVLVKQVIENGGEFLGGEFRRHRDIGYRPLLAFRANKIEPPLPVGSLCSHRATKHIKHDGF